MMWRLIFSSALTFIILHVRGNQNCYHKIFVHNSPDDNLLYDNGFLLEANVSHRAECVSLSYLQDGCNLLFYNPSKALCRLHHYDHANDTDTVVPTTGWMTYARRCREPPTTLDCNVTVTRVLESCESCFYNGAWGYPVDRCIVYKTRFTHTGGNAVPLDLELDLEAGMDVVVKGPANDTQTLFGVYLEDIDFNLDIDMILADGDCMTSSTIGSGTCDEVIPQLDPSWVTFTFRLGNAFTQIFLDDTFIIQYQNHLRRIWMNMYGFGHVVHVQIIRTPDSCN